MLFTKTFYEEQRIKADRKDKGSERNRTKQLKSLYEDCSKKAPEITPIEKKLTEGKKFSDGNIIS